MKESIKSMPFGFGLGLGAQTRHPNQSYNLMDYQNRSVQNHVIWKRKKPKTSLICNDDEEWRAKIEEYLARTDETNNRQSAESAEHTGGD
jgi:hypothetical protein